MTPQSHSASTTRRPSSPLQDWDDPTLLLAALALVPVGLAARALWRAHPVWVVLDVMAIAALAGLAMWASPACATSAPAAPTRRDPG
jgi:hypothetical protein